VRFALPFLALRNAVDKTPLGPVLHDIRRDTHSYPFPFESCTVHAR